MDWFDAPKEKENEVSAITFGVVSEAQAKEARLFSFGAATSTASVAQDDGIASGESEVHDEGPRLTQEDLDRAYAQGYEAARLEFENPLSLQLVTQREAHQRSIASMMEQLGERRREDHRAIVPAVIEIAGMVATEILESALDHAPWLTMELAAQLVERAVEQENLRLFVRPEAARPLQDSIEELVARHPDHADIEIVADERLDVGDCRLVVDGGAIHADLSERLTHLVHAAQESALQHPWFDEEETPFETEFDTFDGEPAAQPTALADNEEE